MSKINVLSFEVANLIAAGEVVDRPASVLKELLENSIDAGATSITAEIRRGGVALIRVCDNGCGMDSSELPIAIKRHATSKINSAEDLNSILTLGFRGEALAAISSVSKMTIISKTANAENAAMLTADCGNIIEVCEVGAKDGTTMLVEDLFANVPARRKFLKKDSTEAMASMAVAERLALSHPSVSFTFISDGETKFKTVGDGNLMNAIYAIYGRDFATRLISCDGENSGISVSGYIGRSDNVRNSRNMQNFFINGRYVKSKTVMAALEQGFTSFIAPEKFPVCVLFLNIDANKVDVNVHPAKLEVKFSDERTVFEAVYYAVRSALSRSEYRAELELPVSKKQSAVEKYIKEELKNSGEQISIYTGERKLSYDNLPKPQEKKTDTRESSKEDVCDVKTSLEILRAYKDSKNGASENKNELRSLSWEDFSSQSQREISARENNRGNENLSRTSFEQSVQEKQKAEIKESEAPTGEEIKLFDRQNKENTDFDTQELASATGEVINDKRYHIIGEAFLCYVFVETEDRLLLIDKHAAHERILFEELKAECEKQGRVTSQPLMIPIEVSLDRMNCALLEESREEMSLAGFEFEVNETTASIYAIPSTVNVEKAEELFAEMAEQLVTQSGNPTLTQALKREKSLYQIACKAAIKGGRSYDEAHIQWIVDKVMQMPDITVCPHGRPIAMEITKAQLDRRFDRLK